MSNPAGPLNSQGGFVTAFRNYGLEGIDLLQQHKQAYQDLAYGVNIREIAIYQLTEFITGQSWFTLGNAQIFRYSYRTTFDLVALNFALNAEVNIPTGDTSLVLTTTTVPPAIANALYPTRAFGGATGVSGTFYFINDPDLYVRFDNTSQTVEIVNNTGEAMTQFYWVMEYLKN